MRQKAKDYAPLKFTCFLRPYTYCLRSSSHGGSSDELLSCRFVFSITRINDDSVAVGGRLSMSGRLALDDAGRLLLLDVDGRRLVQLDSAAAADGGADLRQVREVVAHDERLRYPARLAVDRRRRRLYVADNALSQPTRLHAKFWGKTGRIVVYDIHPS